MKYIYLINKFYLKDDCDSIIRKLRDTSHAFHRDYKIRINHSPEEASANIKRYQNREYVITTIGGDGSINRLLNDMAGSKNILGFLPLGTGNDFYHYCRDHLNSGIHKADIIRINDRYFINTACFGIDADIANDEHFIHNSLIPRTLRYHTGVIRHFLSFKGGRHMKVICDGEEYEGEYTTLVAANGQYYGGGYKVSPASKIDDGLMEVYLVDRLDRFNMAKTILSMKDGGHLSNPALHMFRTKSLSISFPEPVRANIDGEPLQSDHFDLDLLHEAVRIDYDRDFIRAFHGGKGFRI